MTSNRTPNQLGITSAAFAAALAVLGPCEAFAQSVRANPGTPRTTVSAPTFPERVSTRPVATPTTSTVEPAPARRTVTRPERSTSDEARPKPGAASPWWTIAALLFVVGLILALARIWRGHRGGPRSALPGEAVEILGHKSIDGRNGLQLVRLGSRILVLANGPEGLSTLAQIDDPVEVDYLAGMCRSTNREAPVADTFRTWFRKATSERASVDRKSETPSGPSRSAGTGSSSGNRGRSSTEREARSARGASEDELRRRLSDRLQQAASPRSEEPSNA